MEALFLLLALAALLLVLSPIVLFFSQMALKSRVESLEETIKELKRQQRSAETPRPVQKEGDAQTPEKASRPLVRPETQRPSFEASEAVPDGSDFAAAKPTPAKPNDPGPWDTPPPSETPPRINHAHQFVSWLQANWVLAAGAVSLALAGIFLVQYGAERGLLTPQARVLAALAFGAVLLGAGEFMRRRFGDEVDATTQFLPSALSGAGFLSLFAAVLAARMLYELIGPTPAFGALVVVSLLSVLFGWFYGPVLSGVGVVGAIAAPYLVGGQTDTPWLLSYYFALIALAALAIDSVKRWAWLSVLGLAGAAGSIWLIYIVNDFPQHFLATLGLLALGGLAIPLQQARPRHDGPPISALLFSDRTQSFPTWLAFAVTANLAGAALVVGLFGNLAEGYLALVTLALLFALCIFWLDKAPALFDLAVLPVMAFLALLALQPEIWGDLFAHFKSAPAPETAPPAVAWHLTGLAAAASALGFLRFRYATSDALALFWSLGSAAFAPIVVFLLEFLWSPARQYGDFGWALIVIAMASQMTLLSVLAAKTRRHAEPKLHAALFATSALLLIGLAIFLLLTKAALTLCLALSVLLVVFLDRRFDLPLLGGIIMLGILVLSYRVTVDPGIWWAIRDGTSLLDVGLTYLGTGGVLVAALASVRPDRPRQRASIEGGLTVLIAAFVLVALERLLPGRGLDSHWGFGLLAALWLVVSLVQIRQVSGGTPFEKTLRITLAGLVGFFAAIAALMLFTEANPLLSRNEVVTGVPFFSSLAVAYLPLALVIGVAGWHITWPWPLVRPAAVSVASAIGFWYVALSIRHYWRGPVLAKPGVTDPELYSYTVALLLVAAGALIVAFSRRSQMLRKVAMVLVGLTIAKVFLIDMAGLTGLMRVLSFMGLGLALLGLTWINRVMEAQWDRAPHGSEGS